MSASVWIAFGSNQADPIAQLVEARTALAAKMDEQAASPLYRTPPFGITEQPDFINAVVRYQTDLKPHDVLALMMATEQAQGRVRTIKNGPRTLDLDVLLYDEQQIDTPDLCVPHPAMHERAFVLEPLAAIDPDAVIAQHGTVCDCLAALHAEPLPTVEDARWAVR
ncbi:2-amino-4-hydroxy-6-hydroxymethyldihydropteridine diphosphokinase [Cardiobacteriaceae bacterium TAE3-ERU3]|nr:2-amino-4-hydroxy-6-hydroxymethyldihydropteridine diphosphokinase [Cardiobacteriaceae bacterium TAE3-ERU3]